jgi:hypothetical protein
LVFGSRHGWSAAAKAAKAAFEKAEQVGSFGVSHQANGAEGRKAVPTGPRVRVVVVRVQHHVRSGWGAGHRGGDVADRAKRRVVVGLVTIPDWLVRREGSILLPVNQSCGVGLFLGIGRSLS